MPKNKAKDEKKPFYSGLIVAALAIGAISLLLSSGYAQEDKDETPATNVNATEAQEPAQDESTQQPDKQPTNGQDGVEIAPLPTDGSAITPYVQNILFGDMNGDGAVNILDIQTAINISRDTKADSAQILRADLDGDGRLTLRDIDLLIRITLNGSLYSIMMPEQSVVFLSQRECVLGSHRGDSCSANSDCSDSDTPLLGSCILRSEPQEIADIQVFAQSKSVQVEGMEVQRLEGDLRLQVQLYKDGQPLTSAVTFSSVKDRVILRFDDQITQGGSTYSLRVKSLSNTAEHVQLGARLISTAPLVDNRLMSSPILTSF